MPDSKEPQPRMRLGIISDTHNFFDPKIPQLFADVNHILHAGDVGGAFITFQLEQIAPVTAVLGNTDSFLPLKETEVVELDGRRFLVHHIVNPHTPAEPLRTRIRREQTDVVVFGHTHRPFCQVIGGVLYLNPGCAGKQRAAGERSVAILQWQPGGGIQHEFLPL